MARIVDILPTFEEYARKVFLDSPFVRESRWKELYESAHPEVFDAFYADQGDKVGRSAVVRELTIVRDRVREGGPVAGGVPRRPAPTAWGAWALPGRRLRLHPPALDFARHTARRSVPATPATPSARARPSAVPGAVGAGS